MANLGSAITFKIHICLAATFAFPDGSKKFPGIKFGSSIVPGLKVVVVTLVDSVSVSGIVAVVVFSVDTIQMK